MKDRHFFLKRDHNQKKRLIIMMNKKKRRELVERSNSTLKVERPLRKRVKKVELPRKVV